MEVFNERLEVFRVLKKHTFTLDLSVYSNPRARQALGFGISKFSVERSSPLETRKALTSYVDLLV